jgi:sterol-4alpha-carboxylate 3-dehydrogenase (decarboxylating)
MGEGDVQMAPSMLDLFFRGRMHFQIGRNDNLFDFTYVGNVAQAHCLAALALLRTGRARTQPLDHERVDGQAFFITNASPVYFWDLPRMLWAAAGARNDLGDVWVISRTLGIPLAGLLESLLGLVGRKSALTRKAIRFSCMTRFYNIEKARRRLGYEPLVSLEEGVRRTTRYVLEQRGSVGEKREEQAGSVAENVLEQAGSVAEKREA